MIRSVTWAANERKNYDKYRVTWFRMSSTGERVDEREVKHPTSGWDTDAFWYPTLDKRGALLALAIVLFALHFDELFGLASNSTLLFGWLPIEMGYQILQGVLHVGFMYLLYLNWPSPSAEVVSEEPEVEEVEDVEDVDEELVGGDD